MLKKLIHILVFGGFWLCFTPWIVILLQQNYILKPDGITDYFFQYTTLLFVLIVMYWIINRLVEHYFMKHEIQKRVRKVTIKRQLERLERGEIDLSAAQRLSTFTKTDSPKPKRTKPSLIGSKSVDVKKQSTADSVNATNGGDDTSKSAKKQIKKSETEKLIKAVEPIARDNAELPDYEKALKLLEENKG